MSVKLVQIKGHPFYRMYVQQRGVDNSSIRLQKNILFPVGNNPEEAYKAASKSEKTWLPKLAQEIAFLENRGLPFGEVVNRWEIAQRFNTVGVKIDDATIRDHVKRLENFCKNWWSSCAAELTKGDAREVLREAIAKDASLSLQRKIKASVEKVFNWAIEEKVVKGIQVSPVYGLVLDDGDDEEKVPPILTLDEVKTLLRESKIRGHDWFVIWAFALFTGMRSGELFALPWTAIDLVNRNIRVYKSFSRRRKTEKSTKSGYWRNVPISPQLFELIENVLIPLTGDTEYVLPSLIGWEDGYAAEILRDFLRSIRIQTYVVFHTLRACFATHLLASGAEQTKVMKIGGWRDMKTFQIYIRLAGVEERGVTDSLNLLPNDAAVVARVSGLYDQSNRLIEMSAG